MYLTGKARVVYRNNFANPAVSMRADDQQR
jgi:hypothetical protein